MSLSPFFSYFFGSESPFHNFRPRKPPNLELSSKPGNISPYFDFSIAFVMVLLSFIVYYICKFLEGTFVVFFSKIVWNDDEFQDVSSTLFDEASKQNIKQKMGPISLPVKGTLHQAGPYPLS